MYFVHPQIKLKNAAKAILSLVKPIDTGRLKNKLSVYLPERQFIFTDMGRSAFKVIAEKFNLHGSEIIFPAYICDIFYSIFKQYNIKPIFLDVDLETFHIKTDKVAEKITPNTKAIFVCHTYGLPFDADALRSDLPRRSDLAIIEDCAHSFFAKRNGVYTGNLGDISFFSLYKQFPALRGGILACPKDWRVSLPETHFNFRDFISFLNYFWPSAFFFKKFGSEIAPKMLRKEKLPEPAGLARASLNLFADFFDDARNSLQRRKSSALFFQEELRKIGFEVQKSDDNVFCYLSALAPAPLKEKRDEIVQKLKKRGIFCTRIWHAPIILNADVQKEYNIDLSEFPNTIDAARRIINFPLQNYYGRKDIEKMVDAIKKILSDI